MIAIKDIKNNEEIKNAIEKTVERVGRLDAILFPVESTIGDKEEQWYIIASTIDGSEAATKILGYTIYYTQYQVEDEELYVSELVYDSGLSGDNEDYDDEDEDYFEESSMLENESLIENRLTETLLECLLTQLEISKQIECINTTVEKLKSIGHDRVIMQLGEECKDFIKCFIIIEKEDELFTREQMRSAINFVTGRDYYDYDNNTELLDEDIAEYREKSKAVTIRKDGFVVYAGTCVANL